MALVLKDRVKETTTTTGTGTLTLAGAASGFQSFSVIGDGNTTYYTIEGGTEWEVGIGTYTSSGTTLSRDTVLASSAGGTTKVTLSAGTKNVFVTYPADKSIYDDASGNVIALGTPASATLTNATGLPLTTGVTGTLPIANGGTGTTSTTFANLTTNVTGTLPIANGGTGITSLGTGVATFLGTPSSANLAAAVTDETGSGSLVFATSPTLVTPALGTPASGTLTSCTGYTYANLSGTVPTWNQNTTGTAAGLSATLVATSGGTGQSTYAVGDLLQGGATNTLNKLTAVATGNALISGGVTTASSWGKIGLTTHVSGTLPVANGGTGITSLGTNVATALAVNVGSSGAFVTNGGALGTPSSGTVTNLTGTASININGTVGATTATTGKFTTLEATGVTTVQAGTAALPAITTTGDTNTGMWFPAADTIAASTDGSERMRIDSSGNLLFNSGYGSVATAYGCRAWVNFNGSGTVAIRASGNVTSITDNGTGLYLVNMTTAMPDANYSVCGSAAGGGTNANGNVLARAQPFTQTTSQFDVRSVNTANSATALVDSTLISVAVFR